jgi:mono/diheme cytochrome c family protein
MKQALLVCLLATAAGANAQDAERSAAGADGERVFVQKCAMCHRAGGMGSGLLMRRAEARTADLEDREGLTAEHIQTVIRTGIGNMPRISRAEVPDAEAVAIAAYLTKAP